MNPDYPVSIPVLNLRPGLTTWRVIRERHMSWFVRDEYLERRFDLNIAYPHIAFANGHHLFVYSYGASEFVTLGKNPKAKIAVRKNDLRALSQGRET